jgi:hypothetical protein
MIITSNKKRLHFTIKKEGIKYRTFTLSKEEFNELEFNTPNDWQHFLKTSNNYIKIN